ncbi:hypothetical protein ACFZCG_36910 [Streptomyces tanashiensis]|uniref:hypothetical protein n=1 Tax=Streptomyces tanashiensis TaxID=67367 RepID=UPI0036E38516
MDILRDDMRCGICGQLMDAHDAHQQHDDGTPAREGRRVTYVVVALRGATAHYQAIDDPTQTFKTGADWLTEELGIDLSSLVGRQYTCWVEPAEYGVIQSDFKLA